jgi:tellurite methyltransferase
LSEASPLFRAELPRLRAASRLGAVVDLACGRGRHCLAAAREGLAVVGLDRSRAFLSELATTARAEKLPVALARTDLESGHGIPLRPGSCGAVLVFRYLFRPLAGAIQALLAPGGLLLYETFTIHQRKLGHGPSNEAFLLLPGELPTLFPGLQVQHHWEGTTPGPRPWALARLAATKPG